MAAPHACTGSRLSAPFARLCCRAAACVQPQRALARQGVCAGTDAAAPLPPPLLHAVCVLCSNALLVLPPPQFPKLYEGEAVRLVHHSVETAEQLCDTILAHLGARFVQVG